MRVMNVTGIYPYQFNQGRQKNMRETFDSQLNKHLEEKEPFTPCAKCGRNIFEHNGYAFKYDGEWFCDNCIERVDTDRIEPEEYR